VGLARVDHVSKVSALILMDHSERGEVSNAQSALSFAVRIGYMPSVTRTSGQSWVAH